MGQCLSPPPPRIPNMPQCRFQAESVDVIDAELNSPYNPHTRTRDLSVVDRGFHLGCPRRAPPCITLTPASHPPDEAFAAEHMPDLGGYDAKEFQVYHWRLQGWKKLEKKLTSPEFDCGGHKWYASPWLSIAVFLTRVTRKPTQADTPLPVWKL